MLEGGSGDNKEIGQDVGSVAHSSADSASIDGTANVVSKDYMTRDSSGGIVVARGTGDGLILRLDGRVERHILLSTLLDYVESRKSFFSGQEVTLEWIEARPEEGVVAELSEALAARFQLLVKASRMFERGSKAHSTHASSTKKTSQGLSQSIEVDEYSNSSSISSLAAKIRPTPVAPKVAERAPGPNISGAPLYTSNSAFVSSGVSSTSLFDGVTALSAGASSFSPASSAIPAQDRRSLASESLLWDEADTRVIRETLRGGQKIESEHSVVIVGDVNSGAEIVAGGDIFVLGRLRGVAHAGAYDESGGGRRIFSLQMQPTQLRIGSIISQGSEEGGRMPEIAKIEGNMIVVEPYGAGSQVRRLSR